MTIEKRINDLREVAQFLSEESAELHQTIDKANQRNKWFTKENVLLSLKNIREQFLEERKLKQWLADYDFNRIVNPKKVGIVMAGNIPLVGFHDFLCVFLSGHKALIKLSSKDDVLFPFILKKLVEIDEELKRWVTVSEILRGMDAAIATGSNNSSRYFEYYFSKYPNIIRKSRNSVAVLTGVESNDELAKLGFDLFSYFGLGCRNVSKLFVPAGYSFDPLFQAIEKFRSVMIAHHNYMNNYDYNRAVLLLKGIPFLTNDFLIVMEHAQVASPVAMVHYEFYSDENDLTKKLSRDKSMIQCVAGNNFISLGQTQSPSLGDYADNIDTMKFLTGLN